MKLKRLSVISTLKSLANRKIFPLKSLNKDLIAKFIAENFNSCIDKGEFPSELKHVDIVQIHKKKDKHDISNYRPVSILSNYSKVYEKLIYNQLYQYFENILFPSQCGFRKGYSTQHCLLVLIEKFKEAIDTGNKFGALLTDLSKAFDCLDHSLLVAKLHWYGLSPLSLKLIFSYFSNRTHRTKIKECFNNRLKIEYGVPQGSSLGRLLFNINLIDMFYEYEDSEIENYSDDTAPYTCASNINTVISELQITASKLFTWFENSHINANPEKSHLFLSSKTPKKAYFDGALVESSSTEKLLGIQIDSDLTFDEHIFSICNKVDKKINTLKRLVNYMSFDKRRIVMKAFIEPQFNY